MRVRIFEHFIGGAQSATLKIRVSSEELFYGGRFVEISAFKTYGEGFNLLARFSHFMRRDSAIDSAA